MGLRIKTNIASINAQRQLSDSTNALRTAYQKLSSGERINKACDDAAGLAVSENLRANVRSLEMARRNANDGISLVQTAEGGLMETANMLVRLRELAVQASSDTIGNQEREFLDREFLSLKDEIDRIATSTEFNGTRLLTGRNELPPDLTGNSNPFPLEVQVGKDYYRESDSQEALNPVNIIRLDFTKINAFTHGEGSLNIGLHEEGARVVDKEKAHESIAMLDDAMNLMNSNRAYLGAVQNRINSTISNLGVQIENLSESRSRIRDTDFASETANLTKANIMQQAGVSVLANANSQPQIALQLLGQ